jgi:hypothetical protein
VLRSGFEVDGFLFRFVLRWIMMWPPWGEMGLSAPGPLGALVGYIGVEFDH